MKSGKFYAGDNYIFCMVSVAEMPFTFLLVQSDLTYVSGLALGLDRRGALLLGAGHALPAHRLVEIDLVGV